MRSSLLRSLNKIVYAKCQQCSTVAATSPATTKENENLLQRFIQDKIRTAGPITVAEYMKLCIGSQYGYYAKRDEIFGAKGDFVTSPELTQVFGEIVGAWILHELEMTSWKGQWHLVELGPGSGAMMSDILGVLKRFDVIKPNLSVHMVERSDQLIERQKQTLAKRFGQGEIPIHWHPTIEDVPEGFTVFVSNEFFDALPVHQFVKDSTPADAKKSGKWREVYVNTSPSQQDRFCFMLSQGENIHTRSLIPEHIRTDQERTHWEFSPMAMQIANQMVQRFTVHGGFALILDYGHNSTRQTHSLRAYQGHAIVDPLEAPGQVDLTADVDFGEIARRAQAKCLTYGPVEQRIFLSELGMAHRVEYLLGKCKTAEERQALLAASKMLVSEEQMGSHFKAFSMFPNTLAEIIQMRGGAPAGFASTLNNAADGKKKEGDEEE